MFGYVFEHKSAQYKRGDWLASSYIEEVKVIDGRYCFYTANSIYPADSYASIIVSDARIDNIRMGIPPEVASNMNDSANELVALLKLNSKAVRWAQDFSLSINEVSNAINKRAHEIFSGRNNVN